VVTLSCSDTEEALELFSLSPNCGVSSQPSRGDGQEPSSSSDVGSDLFEDWLEGNDMATSVYVAFTTEASSSCALMANTSRGKCKTRAQSSSS
jgi:hypothetical protein